MNLIVSLLAAVAVTTASPAAVGQTNAPGHYLCLKMSPTGPCQECNMDAASGPEKCRDLPTSPTAYPLARPDRCQTAVNQQFCNSR